MNDKVKRFPATGDGTNCGPKLKKSLDEYKLTSKTLKHTEDVANWTSSSKSFSGWPGAAEAENKVVVCKAGLLVNASNSIYPTSTTQVVVATTVEVVEVLDIHSTGGTEVAIIVVVAEAAIKILRHDQRTPARASRGRKEPQ